MAVAAVSGVEYFLSIESVVLAVLDVSGWVAVLAVAVALVMALLYVGLIEGLSMAKRYIEPVSEMQPDVSGYFGGI